MRRAVRRLIPLAAFLLSTGCGVPSTTSVDNRRPFVPPASYVAWWQAVETCSAQTGELARIEWFIADGLSENGRLVRARWEAPHRITLLANETDTEDVVKHEMLHDLLGGDPDHAGPAWDACGLKTVS